MYPCTSAERKPEVMGWEQRTEAPAGEAVPAVAFFRAKSTGELLRGPRSWFERAMKDAKIEEFRWHDLRHTTASRLRQKGAKFEDIAEFLGHESLMMTKKYAHLGPTGLQEIVAPLEEGPTGGGTRIRTGLKTGPRQCE
jgi:site-specific recombinase XerD